MEAAFGYVLFGVVLVAAIVAVLSLRGERYDHVGRGGLFEDGHKPVADTPVAVRDAEIRQMLEASNARRVARGQEPLDVEDELRRLTRGGGQVDPALEAEIRELVLAKNARRVRRGLEPLDVDAEVRRQVDDLMG